MRYAGRPIALFTTLLVAGSALAAADTPFTAAHKALDDWQLEDGKAAAEKLLAEDPNNPEAIFLAARVQHMRGEHLSALSLLEASQKGGISDADMLLPLAESSAAYQASFQTMETEHFEIRYLNKDEIVATYAVPVLEAAYKNIGGDLGLKPAERGEKIVVEIYPDARGLAGATGLTIKEIETSGTIAVCKYHRLMITSPLATADGYGWADTIAHELTHLIISKKSHNNVPIWLHEGIAKYYESRWRGTAGLALGPYSEKLLADAVRKKKFITYQQMHPSMAKLPSQEDAALAFAEVFTTIEFLVRAYGKESVPKVLELLAQDVELEDALKKVYGMRLGGIEQAWKKYLLKRPFHEVAGAKPKAIKLATSDDQAGAPRALEAIQDKDVHDYARLGELLQLKGHSRAAVVEYEKAYARAGVSYATLAYRLARAYADTNREAEALGVLDKTLAAHPDDSDCQLLAGRIRLAKKDYDKARVHFEAVRLENPFNPEIHAALHTMYEAAGDKTKADLETRFLELSKKPRPTRSYEVPKLADKAAHVNIVRVPFGDVAVNGQRLAAPYFGVPVDAGKVTVVAGDKTKGASVGSGDTQTIVIE